MAVRGDTEIQGDIENEIVWDTRIVSTNIGIEVQDGIVLLDGEVSLIREKKAAEQDTWSIIGVLGVDNNINIFHKYEPEIISNSNDKSLRIRLKEKFNWDSNLNTSSIDVEVKKGIVTLTGSVDLLWKKDWAEALTESTLGVTNINNSIEITPFEDVTDEIILAEIMESLGRKLTPKHLENIKVLASSGVVTYKGEVVNDRTWRLLLETACYTSGVLKIDDLLKIKTKKG